MPEPTRMRIGLDDEILVRYGKFALQVEQPPQESAFDIESDEVVAASTGGVVFTSKLIDHYPSIRIEVWTAEPLSHAVRDPSWERTGSALFAIQEKTLLRLRSEFGDWTPALLELFDPGDYHIRAHVMSLRTPAADEPRFYRGLERWLIQIWPDTRS